MAAVQTIGRLLLNAAAPEDMRDPQRVFNKKSSAAFFEELARRHPEDYEEVLQNFNNISRVAGTETGGAASLRLKDLQIPPRLKEYRKQLSERIDVIAQNPSMSMQAKNDKIVSTMRKALPKIMENIEKEVYTRDNAFGNSVKVGFKGSPTQLAQIVFGDMLVADHKGRPIPIPGLHGYGEGVTPVEYWAGSYGARKGFADVQFATAKTGFLGKQLALMAHRLKITGEDCGAKNVGIRAEGDDPEIIGSILARGSGGVPPGTVIEKEHLPKLKGNKPLLRSVITCQQPEGICQHCAGKHDQQGFPPMGSYVGISSARAVGEPMTQTMGLSAKHTGGVVGVNDQNVTGLDEVTQFLQVPKAFKGASVLAPVDGKVQQISPAPQGGHYMHVAGEQVYVPKGRTIEVQKGDTVEAGDMLTDGTPNPAELAAFKGLGEGRVYFMDKFTDILNSNGVPTHRRHVEALSRAFYDRVNVTNPDGVAGYTIGDTVSYSDIQREYKPRKTAVRRAPGRSTGYFLEEPVMHYTIGTKVTPKVAKYLREQNVKDVSVHKDPPGFEPEVIRMMDVAGKDKDWKTRMAGFNLQRSFLDAARRGASSSHGSTSYVNQLMDPSSL